MFRRLLIGTVLLAGAAPIAAQNLADVARAEEARRKAVKVQAKVYTNETLRGPDGGDPRPPRHRRQPPHRLPTHRRSRLRRLRVPSLTATPAADSAKDEKYWRDRLTSARDALGRSQTFAEALQTQINGLYTEFVNMSDPAQRAVIEQKRLAAIAEQDRVKADIARHTKGLADIEEEARRANVPAGWLR